MLIKIYFKGHTVVLGFEKHAYWVEKEFTWPQSLAKSYWHLMD